MPSPLRCAGCAQPTDGGGPCYISVRLRAISSTPQKSSLYRRIVMMAVRRLPAGLPSARTERQSPWRRITLSLAGSSMRSALCRRLRPDWQVTRPVDRDPDGTASSELALNNLFLKLRRALIWLSDVWYPESVRERQGHLSVDLTGRETGRGHGGGRHIHRAGGTGFGRTRCRGFARSVREQERRR